MRKMSDLLRAEESRRLYVLTTVTLAFLTFGLVVAYRFSEMGFFRLSFAVLLAAVSSLLVLGWVHRGGSSLRGGLMATTLLYILVGYSSLLLGGIDGPAFDWFYVVPVLAALLAGMQAGWFFSGLVILSAIFLWIAPSYGLEPAGQVAAGLQQQEALASRLSVVAAIGLLLSALGAQQRHSRSILERVNNELNYEMNQRTEMQARVVRTERAASMGSLAAGMAHEINNPLTYVIGNLELLKTYLANQLEANPPRVRSEIDAMLSEAIEGSYRVAGLVRDLKTFSHINEEETGAVNLAQVIDRASKMVAHEIKHRAQLEIECPESIEVLGNPGRVLQVVINLLSNAAHSVEPGSAKDNRIRVSAKNSEGRVLLRIADTGSGIGPDLRERIFEPFFTTKAVGFGTGMGLSITRNVLHSMGGEINLEYSSPDGTAFVVALPPSENLRGKGARDLVPGQALSASKPELKLLIVDDEEQVLSYLAASLPHHRTEIESDGRRAIRMAAEGDFDVILCDLMMPQVTGMEIYAALQEINPSVANRLIFMTGGAFVQEAVDFLTGFSGRWVEKPIELAELESRIWARVEATQGSEAVD
jgi:signal transduction histidine kinase/CheY-like chemotaxis protein